LKDLGIKDEHVHIVEIDANDRAHYSQHSVDTEFDFPFGQKELLGIAYRTDYDLGKHVEHSSVDLSYFDDETKERVTPHCIEPTFGLDRLVLAVLSDAYAEDEIGEGRTVLKLAPAVAPYKLCVSPLLKNKPELVEKARILYGALKKTFGSIAWDDNGNIGKRYRRQDEIGTPFCITVDFDSLTDEAVTVRDRDTATQERVAISNLEAYLESRLS
jgi:glycyl-tRNA synthetase